MEFVIDVVLAHEALSRIFDVAPSKNQDGSPVGLKIQAQENDMVTFVINDTTIVASSASVAKVSSPGEAVVGLVTLFKAIMGFSPFKEGKGTETIKVKKGTQSLSLTAKTVYKTKVVQQRRSISFFDTTISDLHIISKDKFIDVSVKPMALGLKRVMFSISGSTDTSGFSGVLFEIAGNRIRISSMNGICLTEYTYEFDSVLGDVCCVLDTSFVVKITKLLVKTMKEGAVGNLHLLITDRMFLFKYDGFMVGSSILTTDFPDYSSLLNVKRKYFVIDSEVWSDNLRNIMFNSDKDDDFRATLKFYDGQLVITTKACENEGIELEGDGEGDLHIDFNIYLLEGCVRNMSSEYVVLAYKDRYSPVILKPHNDVLGEKVLSIVAPLK